MDVCVVLVGEGVLVEDTCLDVEGAGFAGINIRYVLTQWLEQHEFFVLLDIVGVGCACVRVCVCV